MTAESFPFFSQCVVISMAAFLKRWLFFSPLLRNLIPAEVELGLHRTNETYLFSSVSVLVGVGNGKYSSNNQAKLFCKNDFATTDPKETKINLFFFFGYQMPDSFNVRM